jgi:hypothetical protein
MFGKVKIFGIESKSKRGFEKGDMHVVITIELMTIVSLITILNQSWCSSFSTWIPLENFKVFFIVGVLLLLLSSLLV